MILVLLLTVSLKQVELAPVHAPVTAPGVTELAQAAGVSTSFVRATQCDDNAVGSFNQQRPHNSDCKAVLVVTAIRAIPAPDVPVALQEPPGASLARLVDLPPPIS